MNRVIVVMGVSGCGKTSVGRQLAMELKSSFHDADDFHPPSNILKMKNGFPLNDKDRYPWLEELALHLDIWRKEGGAVLACSSLKEDYRKILAANAKINWVYLSTNFEIIFNRMKKRDHFMKAEMLQSQFDTLEVPNYGIQVDSSTTTKETVARILSLLDGNE
ncbi:MAG: gluconokinase [Flavobacteriaceae bacterium]|nr:gluconokinase [Flavobacteriaceae bacterium]